MIGYRTRCRQVAVLIRKLTSTARIIVDNPDVLLMQDSSARTRPSEIGNNPFPPVPMTFSTRPDSRYHDSNIPQPSEHRGPSHQSRCQRTQRRSPCRCGETGSEESGPGQQMPARCDASDAARAIFACSRCFFKTMRPRLAETRAIC